MQENDRSDTSASAVDGDVGEDSKVLDEAQQEAPQALPPIDFSTFVLSLGSSAMVNLGQIPAPGEGQTQIDLAAAKQIIDIIGVLEEKTRGNLDDSEEKLITSLLYDLRVQYVDAQAK